jgi:hypothetical protein
VVATQFPGGQSGTLVARAKRLLASPAQEWAAIDAEPMTTGQIFTGWVIPLAAIGPVAQLIGSLVFGYGAFGFYYRPSILAAVSTAIIAYVLALVGVWVLAQVINALAPNFGGTKDSVQAMKVAAYSATAGWLAGIFGLVPAIAFLSLLGLYSLYLLYLGLPRLMRTPADRAMPYTVTVIVVAIVIFLVIGAVASAIGGRIASPYASLAANSPTGSMTLPNGGSVDIGKLGEAAKRMEAAGNAMQSGQAPKTVPGQTLQDMLPGSIGGWNRTEIESQSGGAAGISGSHAEARYASGDQSFRLSVTDTGALGSLATLGGALAAQSNKQTATGYEKAEVVNGRMTSEKWDNSSKSGSFGVMVGSRFMVEAEGDAPSIDTLKGAVASVDLAKLDSMAK